MSTTPDWQALFNEQLECVPVQSNGADEGEVLNNSEIPDGAYEDEARSQGKAKRESQTDELVRFVCGHCELIHDENSDVYAIDRQTREVRHIERRAFRNWLLSAYYSETSRAVRSQALAEALQTLGGLGRHHGTHVAIHIRCVAIENHYVIDLGVPGNSRALRVEPGVWSIVDDPGVMFVRPDSLQMLPAPVAGGSLDELWTLVNVPESSRLLVIAWLIDCLRPDTPFPLLELIESRARQRASHNRCCAG